MMNKKNRMEYLICTMCVVATGFIIYGLLATQQPIINDNKLLSFLLFGCLGGFGFSAMVSTIILSARFFRKRGLKFKIVASILWPITFAVCVYVGFIVYIPYQIYNIVTLVKLSREEKILHELDNAIQDNIGYETINTSNPYEHPHQ